MANTTKLPDQQQVTAHIQQLDNSQAEVVQAIREIILSIDNNISERIKWNNPSFYYTGEMKHFDPKEYKSDIAVFNLHKGRIMLVFPDGARIHDQSGLLEGDYKDGRRLVVFKDLSDVKEKEKQLKKIIQQWIASVDE